MEIREIDVDLEYDMMYCPSTDEVIFAPGYEEINDKAEALIAYWHSGAYLDPGIKDSKLAAAWEQLYERWDELTDDMCEFEVLENFLMQYDNPDWVVLLCCFSGFGCGGPSSQTVYHVVKADTVVKEHPGYEDEDCDDDQQA